MCTSTFAVKFHTEVMPCGKGGNAEIQSDDVFV